MLKFIKNLFKRNYEYHYLTGIVKKNESGKLISYIYLDGQLVNREITISGWYRKKIK